jgi:4-amino-4-deoxy-L-arabinose transferase-like glycosyltransferase
MLTAVLAFALGRLTFGWAAGLGAGLMTALNGALILSEHTVMTEALFVPVLVGALTALVGALRTRRLWLYVAAGLLLGVATLTRPVAQVLVVLIPLVVFLCERRIRPTVTHSAAAIGAFGLLLVPWIAWSASEHDSATVGSLGQTLVGRTARHDRGAFTYYDPAIHDAEGDPVRLHVRKVLQEAADRGSSGKAIHTRLRRELDLSPAEADQVMRDVAIETISRQPGYYLQGTLQRFTRLSLGSVERLAAYRNTSDVARERWENEATLHLLQPATPAEERAVPIATALVAIYQPGYLNPVLPLLAILGLACAFVRTEWRAAIVLGLASLALLGASAALVGNVARYRFPEDPLLAVLACGGLVWLVGWAAARIRRTPPTTAVRRAGRVRLSLRGEG